jgi:hypothetical protein
MAERDDLLLERLRELAAAGGVEATLEESGSGAQLNVALAPDRAGRVLRVEVRVSPASVAAPVLETSVSLPYGVKQLAIAELARFLLAVNGSVPLGGFGLSEGRRLVYYRHNAAVRAEAFDAGLALASIAAAGGAIATFGPLIEDVASGKPLTEALEELTEIVALVEGPGGEEGPGGARVRR